MATSCWTSPTRQLVSHPTEIFKRPHVDEPCVVCAPMRRLCLSRRDATGQPRAVGSRPRYVPYLRRAALPLLLVLAGCHPQESVNPSPPPPSATRTAGNGEDHGSARRSQRCGVSQLRVGMVPVTPSKEAHVIVFTNVSQRACRFSGYAFIQAYAQGDPIAVRQHAGPVNGNADPGPHWVLLAPGQVASFELSFIPAHTPGTPVLITDLDITPPGTSRYLRLLVQLRVVRPVTGPIAIRNTAVQLGIVR
jgi:Protein of unknown function (DUF4232)